MDQKCLLHYWTEESWNMRIHKAGQSTRQKESFLKTR